MGLVKTEPMVIHVQKLNFIFHSSTFPNSDNPADLEHESETRSAEESSSAHLDGKQQELWTDDDLVAILRGESSRIQTLEISKMVPGEVHMIS